MSFDHDNRLLSWSSYLSSAAMEDNSMPLPLAIQGRKGSVKVFMYAGGKLSGI